MNDEFNTKIKAARKKAGLSQQELADALNMSVSAIRGYERGDRRPKIEGFRKIAEVCGVPVSSLMGIRDDIRNISYTKHELFSKLLSICNSAHLITPEAEEQKAQVAKLRAEEKKINDFRQMGFEPTKEKLLEIDNLRASIKQDDEITNGEKFYLEQLGLVIAALEGLNILGLSDVLNYIASETEDCSLLVAEEHETNRDFEEFEALIGSKEN